MTNLTPEHKQFAELGGWITVPILGFRNITADMWKHPNDPSNFRDALPDFDTDLQACFDVLEHFCRANSKRWMITDHLQCWLGPIGVPIQKMTIAGTGHTKQLCIIQAVLTAARAGKPDD